MEPLDLYRPPRTGFSSGILRVDPWGRIEKPKIYLGQARRLTELTDLHFFNPAVLYLHGAFQDSYLIDFVDMLRQPVQFYHYLFQKPIFGGLVSSNNRPEWNHALWAVRCEYWPALEDYLCSMHLMDPVEQDFIRYGVQEFSVPDPLEHDLLGMPGGTRVRVSVLGLDALSRRLACVQLGSVGVPTLRRFPPRPSTRVAGIALLSGHNPHLAQEAYERALKEEQEDLRGRE